jgi:hypothetical protein
MIGAMTAGHYPSMRTRDMTPLRRTAGIGLATSILTLAVAGCGEQTPSPSPSPGIDLSAIACATEDPTDVGDLTGAWQGDDTGVYYIRQVGDCLWWFGTEVDDIPSGQTRQSGFANVAVGRVDGTQIVVEWADLPAGDVLSGGGLTLVYDEENNRLTITEQRGGGQPYGATMLTRIEPQASAEASPSESATSEASPSETASP